MGSFFSTNLARTFGYLVVGLGGSLVLGYAAFSLLKRRQRHQTFAEILQQIDVSYDEDEDLDCETIVAIIDAQNSSDRVKALKEEFNIRRKELMNQLKEERYRSGLPDLFQLNDQPGPVLESYIITVIQYERRIC